VLELELVAGQEPGAAARDALGERRCLLGGPADDGAAHDRLDQDALDDLGCADPGHVDRRGAGDLAEALGERVVVAAAQSVNTGTKNWSMASAALT
jgi:hypothetical protein